MCMKNSSILFSLLLVGLLFSNQNLFAQNFNACVDTNRVQSGQGQCPYDFNPVCGCDNITYNNLCLAQLAAVNFYQPGPCEPLAFNFFPNPVQSSTFILDIVSNFPELTVNMWITDLYGKIYFFQMAPGFSRQQFTINTSGFPGQLYLVILETNNYRAVKKLVVPVLRD